jgi:cell division protein FtsN
VSCEGVCPRAGLIYGCRRTKSKVLKEDVIPTREKTQASKEKATLKKEKDEATLKKEKDEPETQFCIDCGASIH